MLRMIKNEEGSMAVTWALLMPAIVGGLVLGVDVGGWYLAKRNLQAAVDAAATSTGFEIDEDATSTSLQSVAFSELARNGITIGGDISATFNFPPVTGSYSGNDRAIELIVTQVQPLAFLSYFRSTPVSVQARAVAYRAPAGRACVLALDGTVNSSLTLQGNPTINLNCIAAANSTSETAISIGGSSVLNAQTLYTAGNYRVFGSATLNTVDSPVTHGSALEDPFEDINPPSVGSCPAANNGATLQGTVTINPGVFCNGLRVNSNANVTMNPGVYIMDRGEFNVNGNSTITGNGVTIILTSGTGGNYATMSVNGGARMNITAPTSGTYSGIAFMQDRRAVASNVNRFNGGSTMNITGALYFPNQEVEFTGGNSIGSGSCTEIVAREVNFSGNANMHSTCENQGIEWVTTPGEVRLVE